MKQSKLRIDLKMDLKNRPYSRGDRLKIQHSNVYKTYDDNDIFDILNRYSSDAIVQLLNRVTSNDKKDKKSII